MPRYILVTGGAGFIGSHICKALARAGMVPVTYDNLSTGHIDSVRWGPLIQADIANGARLRHVMAEYSPDCVIHCGANAYVGESVERPSIYYRNNVIGSLSLLDACLDCGIDKIVFSSSCATYGIPEMLPICEKTPQQPVNPYGRTKLIFEMALEDYAAAYGTRFAALRYFNAAGADPEGQLAERHYPETHLIPRALLAASGRIESLDIFGIDYSTNDGTCVRDYIHVSDLAQAHLAAVRHLLVGGNSLSLNLGSGRGTSVGEILNAVKRKTGHRVPIRCQPRRAGDPPVLFADTKRARLELDFMPTLSDIDTIIRTAGPTFGLEVIA
jgi:UDP-arabinose 4-epimerase